MVKSGLMVTPENRAKANALIKMYARNPERYPGPIVSHDDAFTELVRVYELHNGEIREPVTPSSMKGPLKSVKIIGAEGM